MMKNEEEIKNAAKNCSTKVFLTVKKAFILSGEAAKIFLSQVIKWQYWITKRRKCIIIQITTMAMYVPSKRLSKKCMKPATACNILRKLSDRYMDRETLYSHYQKSQSGQIKLILAAFLNELNVPQHHCLKNFQRFPLYMHVLLHWLYDKLHSNFHMHSYIVYKSPETLSVF